MAISFVANVLGGTAATIIFSPTLPATYDGVILILEFIY